jgi:hypothetical protein
MKQGTGNREQGTEAASRASHGAEHPLPNEGVDAARKGGIGGMPPESKWQSGAR